MNPDKHSQYIFPLFLSGFPCSHHCSYCNAAGSSGVSEALNPEQLRLQIVEWSRSVPNGIRKQVAIYGCDLPSLGSEMMHTVLDTLKRLIHTGVCDSIRISVRPDTIRSLGDLKTREIRVVELGVPSASEAVLTAIHRKHTWADVVDAVHFIKRAGVSFGIQTMIGLPGSDDSEHIRTAEKVAALMPDFVRIHPALVLADTRLARAYYSGSYQPQTLDSAVEKCVQAAEIYRRNSIEIARIGFHIPESQRESILIAGPYHPSFGSLVNSELRYRELQEYFRNKGKSPVYVPDRLLSDYIGYKRRNLIRLQSEFPFEIEIKGSSKYN